MQQMDDPPYLSVGTEVSAKYKGAFCEAKVRKVVRNIKCKVAYKQGLGSGTVSDDQIKGDILRVGAIVEVKHPDRRDLVEATITKIQDCSQYTVVFDDGDITTLRRSALCLKSGRHFNESETLDQLPLTHPEHFGNPVIGGRRGRSCRSRQMQDDSSDEEEEQESKQVQNEKEEHIGKVVCVESTDTKKKAQKENWFPALVVSPTTQENIRIRVKDEYLVRSFKDGRYYTVPKKEATEFTREKSHKQEGPAIQAALEYLDSDILPPHWDRDSLFGIGASSSDFDQDFDSDSSDDEPREEKDHFVAQLYKYMDDRGTPLNKSPSITNRDVDLYRLFRAVHKLGGYNRVTSQNQWKSIAMRLGFTPASTSITNLVKQAYKKFLQPFEEFNRKLGCTMVAHPRANRIKGRSLVRANSVASPKPTETKDIGHSKHIVSALAASAAEESENNSESGAETIKSTKRKLSTASLGKVKALVDKFEEKAEKIEKIKDEVLTVVVETPQTPTTSKARIVKEEPLTPSTQQSSTLAIKKEKDFKEKEIEKDIKEKEKEVKEKDKDKDKDKEKSKQIDSKNNEKRGRKKKDNENDKSEKKEADSTTVEPDFPIEVGDKLRVYYHEQKVTYEAKVIEIAEQNGSPPLYLVHYTGWNTRYDEWVPKDRIAENITNNKSKRPKSGSTRGNNNSSGPSGPATTPTSSNSKLSAKRGRGGSRSDSQPPRSTTPSSVASNSSRTKSPATSAQRRTTRGQPSTLRRTSNNTDISSLQTESDTDSDEPVKKLCSRTPSLINSGSKSSVTPTTANSNNPTAMAIGQNSRSGSSQDEETFSGAKGRDYDLNQIRSELKGFKEIKSPSPDTERIPSSIISKSEADIKVEVNEEKPVTKRKSSPMQGSSSKSSSSSNSDTSKTSSDISSETDSLGEDDSQSSIDKCVVKKPLNSIIPAIKYERPLKTYTNYLEKTYNKVGDTLTKEIKLLKSFKTILQQDVKMEIEKKLDDNFSIKIEEKVKIPEKVQLPVKVEKPTTPPKTEKKSLISEKSKILSKNIEKPSPEKVQPVSNISLATSSISSSLTDVYEFKEPEPFEFETASTPSKKIPNIDITEKRKIVKSRILEENLTSDPKPSAPENLPKSSPTIKRKKTSPNKESDNKNTKLNKKEEVVIPIINSSVMQTPTSPISSPSSIVSMSPEDNKTNVPLSSISNQSPIQFKIISAYDSTFDVLRKSPCFNIKGGSSGSDTSFSEHQNITPIKPGVFTEEKNTLIDIPKQEKLFDSLTKIEDKKIDVHILDPVKIENDSNTEYGKELETVKKLMLNETFVDLEPPKIEKPSIADKVLKALNQQNVIPAVTNLSSTVPLNKDKIESPIPVLIPHPSVTVSNSPPTITAITTIETIPSHIEIQQSFKILELSPAININTKKEIDSFSRKSILSSPDILESITPKNNDLNETIQKLESAIKKTTTSPVETNVQPNLDRFIDDSSDSTDSEQRLVIEDESLSSGATTPVNVHVQLQNEINKTENLHIKEDIRNFSNFSPLKFQEGIFGSITSRPPLDKQQLTAVEFLTSGMIERENERLSLISKQQQQQQQLLLQKEKQIPVIEPPQPIIIAAMTNSPIKKDIELHHTPAQSIEQTTQNESISMLLCEETIPGSPAPSCGNTPISLDQPKKLYEPPFINQNTHPTSSDIKPVPMEIENDIPSAKPQIDEHEPKSNNSIVPIPSNVNTSGGGLSGCTSSSSPRDSISPDDSKSESEDTKKREIGHENISPKKRRRPRKSSECDVSGVKRRKHMRKHTNGSDSDDNNSDSVVMHRNPRRSPKPCQYNFLVQLDNSLSSNSRINILKKKIQELRKTYNMIKAELASIDRRRKKLRRREREKNKLAKASNI